ncbi:MAG TPA: hypothetical protein P5246_06920, partial [Candidatus Omnitrophota bacterium]|nr:hypothetical protein [Candidatus Omnitrophota bacterium]
MRLRTKTGFTLAEILIAVLILIPVCVATIYVFIKCVELSELARHSSEAVREIKSKVTQIENTPFDQIKNTFHNVTFAPAGLNAMGVTYIDDTEPDMLTVTAAPPALLAPVAIPPSEMHHDAVTGADRAVYTQSFTRVYRVEGLA